MGVRESTADHTDSAVHSLLLIPNSREFGSVR